MPVRTWLLFIKKCIFLITIEPTMILYMMAFMLTTVIEQAFFIHKACRVNHNFTEEVCKNLTQNEEENKIVQVTVSEFHQWNDIAGHVVPIILALFMGAWSDKRGRKLPLMLGLIGKFYYSTMIIVNTLQDTWPVEYIIYTATLPMAFTGADVAIFAACLSYLSDVTTQKNRTVRVTILEVCYLATMPTGIALGSYLFSKVTNQSYTIMFTINASLLLLSIMYSMLFLKMITNEKQRPISEANNIITDFFDIKHVTMTVHTLVKWRPKNRRTYLIMMIVAMGFYSFQRDEKHMSYLYLQLVIKWSLDQISMLRTFQSALQDVVLLLVVPFMGKILHWRDTTILIFGSICHSIGRLFFAFAKVGWVMYVGAAFAAVGPITLPIIRSVVSKLVEVDERGKVFSLLSVTDNATPLFSGIAYNKVYINTIHTHPASIFYLTIGTQIVVLIVGIYIHFRAEVKDLVCENDTLENFDEISAENEDDMKKY